MANSYARDTSHALSVGSQAVTAHRERGFHGSQRELQLFQLMTNDPTPSQQQPGNPGRTLKLPGEISHEEGHGTGSVREITRGDRAGQTGKEQLWNERRTGQTRSAEPSMDRGMCRAVTQEAVPSGLSFSRNHFLKGKKRGKINFCYYYPEIVASLRHCCLRCHSPLKHAMKSPCPGLFTTTTTRLGSLTEGDTGRTAAR